MTHPPESPNQGRQRAYWSASLRVALVILSLWFVLSLGCGVLFRQTLDRLVPPIGGAPFGFWMAQQGSILGFVVLLILYMIWMNRLDTSHGYGEGDPS